MTSELQMKHFVATLLIIVLIVFVFICLYQVCRDSQCEIFPEI
jgi:hypothetical protein